MVIILLTLSAIKVLKTGWEGEGCRAMILLSLSVLFIASRQGWCGVSYGSEERILSCLISAMLSSDWMFYVCQLFV